MNENLKTLTMYNNTKSKIIIIHHKLHTGLHEKNTLLNLSSHHTVKAVQLIY